MSSLKCVSIRVFGKVQGVFFRQSTKEKADELHLTGWVSNEPDGSVLIVAEGEEEKLQKLVAWAKVGTEWAEIDKVEVEWQEAKTEFKDFKIK